MRKMAVFLVFLLIVGSVTERLNKKELRENTKRINYLEHSNSLLIAENRQIKSEVNRLTQSYKRKFLSGKDLNMVLPNQIYYAKVDKGEVNLIFVFTDKI